MTELTSHLQTFDLPLDGCPQIVQAAANSSHGTLEGYVERYRLDRLGGFWCLNLFMGTGELRIDGRPFDIRHGFAGITCPGMELEYRYFAPARLTWVHFLPASTARTTPIPAMQDLAGQFHAVLETTLDAIRYLPHCPQRAQAIFWALLWRLTDVPGPSQSATCHAVVRRAMEYVELHLGQRQTCSGLAGELGISQNHLLRLFRASLGVSVMQYVRQRRVYKAKHLLTHSTLPIKDIAWEVGVPDLVVFNHLIHRELGKSPRQVRRERVV